MRTQTTDPDCAHPWVITNAILTDMAPSWARGDYDYSYDGGVRLGEDTASIAGRSAERLSAHDLKTAEYAPVKNISARWGGLSVSPLAFLGLHHQANRDRTGSYRPGHTLCPCPPRPLPENRFCPTITTLPGPYRQGSHKAASPKSRRPQAENVTGSG